MSEELVNIEVNGVPMKARKGAMIIQVTDAAGIYVPRFCYHEKLSIAANCRMCLVEVEKAPKPAPACATPVLEGMKVFTKSPRAISAQKATMEFLLINHPLDCPICDQGGECELQDLAMGFGRDLSRFTERKRVVKDKNIGPLVSTDMTRCIQCTRCVRFGQEIAGIQELGTLGRGEWMEIGTYLERSVDHELSGNVIDVCPVGALNSKPFRYRARAWEMSEHPLIAPHDAMGSHLSGHVLRGRLMRVVPRPNEAINETWIADRDRFSYEGVYADDRLQTPLVRRNGAWQSESWETALGVVASGLRDLTARHGPASVGGLASPSATLEELHLFARVVRGLGSPHLDHRLRQQDFRDQEADPLYPSLGMPIAEFEQVGTLLVVGCNLRREAPILAHRIRKAVTRRGARVSFINQRQHQYFFPVSHYITAAEGDIAAALAGLISAIAQSAKKAIPEHVHSVASNVRPTDEQRALGAELLEGENRVILLGTLAARHPAFADIRQLAAALAEMCGARVAYLSEGANSAGAHLAGVLPHRNAGGEPLVTAGLNARAMLENPLKAYMLLGAIEPGLDVSAQAQKTLAASEFVVMLTPFATEAMRAFAHVLLPIGTFAETSGTFINAEGRWQSFLGAAQPVGESRPGWKVLRVLGNLLELVGFDYITSEDVRNELKSGVGESQPDTAFVAKRTLNGERAHGVATDVPMYQVDALVRRAPALQRTREAQQAAQRAAEQR
ncbi:MAG TPA: NADH-quinone oxidoreductase subunit NuoG [Steroidobacteraceae bacterium]|nr:NADH-quinone oxidoreductase subunit NuoG [Steroidobacteraceae bacterium]